MLTIYDRRIQRERNSSCGGLMATITQVQLLLLVFLLLLQAPGHLVSAALGGEIAFFNTTQMTPGVTHRQNVCGRYDEFRKGNVELKDALEGIQLHVLMGAYVGAYFNYDESTGIHPDNPGLAALLMDELGRRGKFTWRDTFGVFYDPGQYGESWTDVLLWGVNTYDINVDWWAKNLQRMNMGVAFLNEWYDSSIILITKETSTEISDEINFWNWLRPYDWRVWLLTLFTILLSGLVSQLLQWLGGEYNGCDDCSFWEWFGRNFYLSAINFTQIYEFTPKTFASRLFGISMALWALLMTATYTANLASLLVDRTPLPIDVETVEEIAVFKLPICTLEGTNSDSFIADNYPSAIRLQKKTIEDVYLGLNQGECAFAAEVKSSWSKLKSIRQYNPTCDLKWVGDDRTVSSVDAGFATKADSGYSCSGLIRDVINLHMQDLINDGFLEDAWDREFKRSQDIDCNSYRPLLVPEFDEDEESPNDRRLVGKNSIHARNSVTSKYKLDQPRQKTSRMLKAGGKSAAATAAVEQAESDTDASRLTLQQMIGTFAIHWALMAVAVAIAVGRAFCKKVQPKILRSYRTHLKFHKQIDTPEENVEAKTLDPELQKETYSTTSTSGDSARKSHIKLKKGTGEIYLNEEFKGEGVDTSSQTERLISCLQREVEEMRQSQISMYQLQKEMFDEQRNLQEHIQLLASALAKH